MTCIIHDRVDLARQGKSEFVICKMNSGWAVMGDEQYFEGYCLLLPDPVVDHLTDLDENERSKFLLDMASIGEALMEEDHIYRINYAIIGQVDAELHAHIYPRSKKEDILFKHKTIWEFPDEEINAVKFDLKIHGALRERLRKRLSNITE